MLVKFDAHKVFTAVDKRDIPRSELQAIVGFMVADFIERLNPFSDDAEVDVTDRMVEGIAILDRSLGKKADKNKASEKQPAKLRGRPPKVKKDIYTLAREKTAGRSA